MDARSAPERICRAHLADQLPNFEGHLGPAGSPSRLPAPEAAESSTMPSHNRLRPNDCHASRAIGASRYRNTKIKRSKDVRAGRLGVLRRSTFNWWRSAITSPSSELLDRKRSRRIQLSRLKGSSTRRSSPDSGAQAKRMEFAVETGSRSSLFAVDQAAATAERLPRRADKAPVTCDIEIASASREVQPRRGSGPEMH
jgi:hypothetical protein